MRNRIFSFLFLLALSFPLCAAEPPSPGPDASGGAGAAADEKPAKPLDYPNALRRFRLKALEVDGHFAPDIAFSVHFCPKCGKPYVFGTFPRLKRQPFDELAAIHETIETICIKRPAPRTIYSAREKKEVPRACPYCKEPEHIAGRPPAVADRVLFCHFLPETGEDMQIEYEIRDRKLAAHTFWRASPSGEGRKVEMPDESEASFVKAFGCHFSLRAVWNELFAAEIDGNKVSYREVSPGLYFVFKPEQVSQDEFTKFAEGQLKADREKGLFTRLESPVNLRNDAPIAGTYRNWARKWRTRPEVTYADFLEQGRALCYVGISFPALRKAAAGALASHKSRLTLKEGEKPSEPGTGTVTRGAFTLNVDLTPLVYKCAVNALSLEQVCALELADVSFVLDNAERLDAAIRRRLPRCEFTITDGRFLVARDSRGQERKINLLLVGGKLDFDDPYLFELYCNTILAWDPRRNCFGPPAANRDVSPIGLPAFIERRIRPAGFLKERKIPAGLFEPLADDDGKRYEVCYTSECPATVTYLDPSTDRFAGMTINAALALYQPKAGVLPLSIVAEDALVFPGADPRLVTCRAAILCGVDLASLAADPTRATALADAARISTETKHIHFYAFNTNVVALAPRRLTPDEFGLLRSRVDDFVKESGVEPGLALSLRFDIARAEPRGKILRRTK